MQHAAEQTKFTIYEQELWLAYAPTKIRALGVVSLLLSVLVTAVATRRFWHQRSTFCAFNVLLGLAVLLNDTAYFVVQYGNISPWLYEYARKATGTISYAILSGLTLFRFQVFRAAWFTTRVYGGLMAVNIALMIASLTMVGLAIMADPAIPEAVPLWDLSTDIISSHLVYTLVLDMGLTLLTLRILSFLRQHLSSCPGSWTVTLGRAEIKPSRASSGYLPSPTKETVDRAGTDSRKQSRVSCAFIQPPTARGTVDRGGLDGDQEAQSARASSALLLPPTKSALSRAGLDSGIAPQPARSTSSFLQPPGAVDRAGLDSGHDPQLSRSTTSSFLHSPAPVDRAGLDSDQDSRSGRPHSMLMQALASGHGSDHPGLDSGLSSRPARSTSSFLQPPGATDRARLDDSHDPRPSRPHSMLLQPLSAGGGDRPGLDGGKDPRPSRSTSSFLQPLSSGADDRVGLDSGKERRSSRAPSAVLQPLSTGTVGRTGLDRSPQSVRASTGQIQPLATGNDDDTGLGIRWPTVSYMMKPLPQAVKKLNASFLSNSRRAMFLLAFMLLISLILLGASICSRTALATKIVEVGGRLYILACMTQLYMIVSLVNEGRRLGGGRANKKSTSIPLKSGSSTTLSKSAAKSLAAATTSAPAL